MKRPPGAQILPCAGAIAFWHKLGPLGRQDSSEPVAGAIRKRPEMAPCALWEAFDACGHVGNEGHPVSGVAAAQDPNGFVWARRLAVPLGLAGLVAGIALPADLVRNNVGRRLAGERLRELRATGPRRRRAWGLVDFGCWRPGEQGFGASLSRWECEGDPAQHPPSDQDSHADTGLHHACIPNTATVAAHGLR